MKKRRGRLFGIVVITAGIGLFAYSRWDYKRTINTLISMSPQDVTTFKISRTSGQSILFTPPDPIISEFFDALKDLRSYPISRDSAEINHQWFLEISSGDIMFQIVFYIPYQKGDIVVGILGDFSESWHSYNGDFQSQQLFQWYQKYKDRWLTPAAPPPGATAAPTPP